MNEQACPRCESTRIAEDLRIQTRNRWSETDLTVVVPGKPVAVFLDRDALFELHARVCGACGYTELYAERPEELYDIVCEAEEAR